MTGKPSRRRTYSLTQASKAVDVLFSALGGAEKLQLLALWEHWAFAVGAEVAELGVPLGHTDATLLIGVDDSMALQELSMQTPDILERVNAFLDAPLFSRVRVILRQNQRPLTEKRPPRSTRTPSTMPPPPPRLGKLVFSPDSPIADCYAAYVQAFRTV